jgi:SP family sugar:H+ symporter-like MFS transporter
VFFIWGSFCFVCIAFVYFMIYETKGLTLEEVDGLYARVTKAWLSQKYRPEVRFAEAEKEMQVAAAEGRHMSVAQAMEALVERRRSTAAGVHVDTTAANKAEFDGGNEAVGDEKQV